MILDIFSNLNDSMILSNCNGRGLKVKKNDGKGKCLFVWNSSVIDEVNFLHI